MASINIHGVPNAPGGYSLTGKKVMVHDPLAPLASSTVLVDPAEFAGSGTGGGYMAPMWKEADGDMTVGSNTFTHASLIGATQMNQITVNKVIEYIDEDYTFDNTIGQIVRTNTFQVGDKMVTPYKPA